MWTVCSFFTLKRVLQFYTVILSIDAFHTKPSLRFVESLRRIDNCIKDTLMLLKNILGEPFGDSMNLREGLTPFAAILRVPLTQNKEKLENRELRCQSFSEIQRISKKVWHETHQYLKKLSKIREPSLKFKNEKRFPFRPRKIHRGQKRPKNLMRQSL